MNQLDIIADGTIIYNVMPATIIIPAAFMQNAKVRDSMFFHADNFSEIVEPDQAVLIAKVANNILDKNSKVFYGRMYSDEKCEGFGTNKDRTDTHVCLGVEVSIMGSFQPTEVPIKLDRPTKQDLERAQSQRIEQLERENTLLRGGK